MKYKQILQEDQRLVILRSLDDMQGYSANDSILQTVLEQYGHGISRDQVRTHINWLEEQGLIIVESAGETLVATLSTRGVDVAQGRAKVTGVKRPSPKG